MWSVSSINRPNINVACDAEWKGKDEHWAYLSEEGRRDEKNEIHTEL